MDNSQPNPAKRINIFNSCAFKFPRYLSSARSINDPSCRATYSAVILLPLAIFRASWEERQQDIMIAWGKPQENNNNTSNYLFDFPNFLSVVDIYSYNCIFKSILRVVFCFVTNKEPHFVRKRWWKSSEMRVLSYILLQMWNFAPTMHVQIKTRPLIGLYFYAWIIIQTLILLAKITLRNSPIIE